MEIKVALKIRKSCVGDCHNALRGAVNIVSARSYAPRGCRRDILLFEAGTLQTKGNTSVG